MRMSVLVVNGVKNFQISAQEVLQAPNRNFGGLDGVLVRRVQLIRHNFPKMCILLVIFDGVHRLGVTIPRKQRN